MMENKELKKRSSVILFNSDARKRLFKGLDVAANVVGCTLGPRGKTVLIKKGDKKPVNTKDGVSVAQAIVLNDPVEMMGAQMVLEAAQRTNEVAGDGTTTATVISQALVKEGLKLIEAGHQPRELCADLEDTSKKIIASLRKASKKLTSFEEIKQVGTVSANGDGTIGSVIARAMEAVGTNGVITVEDAKGTTTSVDVIEGLQFDRGYLSPYFITSSERQNAVHHDALVSVIDKTLTSMQELIPLLEHALKLSKPLLIIANDIEGEALQGLVVNRVKSNMALVAVKSPGFGALRVDHLEDVCTLTGAKLVSSSTGVPVSQAVAALGRVKKLVVDARSTLLVGTGNTQEAVTARVMTLTERATDPTLAHEELEDIRIRVAKLSKGVAIVRVGGATEMEMIERRYRIEDALNATRAAAEEGIVPGGGTALFDAFWELTREGLAPTPGTNAALRGCLAPLKRIVANSAKVSPEVIVNKLSELRSNGDLNGYNAASDKFEDLVSSGIIDPVKVTASAFKHATSVAVAFLSLDAVICDEDAS